MLRTSVAVFCVVLVCGGCASYRSANRTNIVATTGQGDPIFADHSRPSDAEFASQIDTVLSGIDAHAPAGGGVNHVLIHIHGGLKSYSASFEQADRLRRPMEDAGYYPVFIVWPSGLLRAYSEHLLIVRQGRRRHPLWGLITAPYHFVRDLLDGVINAPSTYWSEFATFASAQGRKVSGRQTDAQKRSRALQASVEDSLRVIEGGDRRGSFSRSARFALYFVTGVARLVTIPIVDGYGESAFENMRRRTETMFRRPEEYESRFNEDATNPAVLKEYGSGTGAIERFLLALEHYAEGHPELEITLVGHSMGTIVANRIIRYHPHLPIGTIVYMAAACTINDFRDTVVPYMIANPKTVFYNLSLHRQSDAGEIQWWTLDLAPRGSLLEWVDNFFSEPETEADLVLGKWDNIMLASHLIPVTVRDRVLLRSFDAGVDDCPSKHGTFGDFEFWTPVFWGETEPPGSN
jgi:pimeloyl-ACP methyl ester carboxylesterase